MTTSCSLIRRRIWPISCSSGTRSEYGLTLNMQRRFSLSCDILPRQKKGRSEVPCSSRRSQKSMMLCGHPNYEAEISRFMDNVEKMKGVVLDNENDAAQKAEQKRTA